MIIAKNDINDLHSIVVINSRNHVGTESYFRRLRRARILQEAIRLGTIIY
jgi:hypothetical protein